MVKYMGTILVVEEIAPSRFFYEQLLGQKVRYDFGPNVTFEGDFAIHLRLHLQELMDDWWASSSATGFATWSDERLPG